MPSNSRQKLKANRDDLDSLWDLHKEKAGDSQGRKFGVEVLNKSVVIFVCAAWEAYCEDLVLEAVSHLTNDCRDHAALPEKPKALIAEKLKQQKNPHEIWKVADDGWRHIYLDYAKEQVSSLNTPKPHNLDKLFENTLGIKSLSESWKWTGCSNAHAKKRLTTFIELRGEIAHRLKPDKPVHKKSGKDFFSHVSILADLIDESVGDHISAITGQHYW